MKKKMQEDSGLGSPARLGRKQLMELHKRKLKGANEIVTKGVDLDPSLIDSVPAETRQKIAHLLEDPEHLDEVNNRDVISAAVASYLPEIVRQLRAVGLVHYQKGNQRPRVFDDLAWDCLLKAEGLVDVHAIILVRAALSLLAAKGATTVDLRLCLSALQDLDPEASVGPQKKRRGRTSS